MVGELRRRDPRMRSAWWPTTILPLTNLTRSSTRIEEERDLAAHGVGSTAIDRRLEAARSCAETHGEPDFDAHVAVGRHAIASLACASCALPLKPSLRLCSLRW